MSKTLSPDEQFSELQFTEIYYSHLGRKNQNRKKLENFGGHLLSKDDHSYWAPPYWNITKETFSLGRTEL